MIADVNMLRSCMELVVLCECDRALVIGVEGDRVSKFGCDFAKELSNPENFFHVFAQYIRTLCSKAQ